jgi:hypothetical protein
MSYSDPKKIEKRAKHCCDPGHDPQQHYYWLKMMEEFLLKIKINNTIIELKKV